MSPDAIFSFCNALALIGWLLLAIASPFWTDTDKVVVGIIVALLALIYAWSISQSLGAADLEKFSTLEGVMSLFTSKMAVTAGWVHYLAFDLMTGAWIRRNAVAQGIGHWLVLPCLLFTFMMGPVGLLMYLLIRTITVKRYFASNH